MNVFYRLIIGFGKESVAHALIQSSERPIVPKDPFPYVSATGTCTLILDGFIVSLSDTGSLSIGTFGIFGRSSYEKYE